MASLENYGQIKIASPEPNQTTAPGGYALNFNFKNHEDRLSAMEGCANRYTITLSGSGGGFVAGTYSCTWNTGYATPTWASDSAPPGMDIYTSADSWGLGYINAEGNGVSWVVLKSDFPCPPTNAADWGDPESNDFGTAITITAISTSGSTGASNSASGYSGYSGASVSGYSGYSGASTSGFSGYSGFSGANGTGTSGYSGYSGQGVSGYSGFSGAGVSGYSGYSGSGISGYSGFSGKSGYSGFSGAGTSGFSGFSGSATSGFSGYSGTNGSNGSTGTSGFSGYSGSGISGYSGFSGKSGYSGYSGAGISGYSGYSGSGGALTTTVTLGTTVNDTTTFVGGNVGVGTLLVAVQATGRITNTYFVNTAYNQFGAAAWYEVLPLSQGFDVASNAIALDVVGDGGSFNLRLRRKAGSDATSFLVTILQLGNSTLTFSSSTGSTGGTNPTQSASRIVSGYATLTPASNAITIDASAFNNVTTTVSSGSLTVNVSGAPIDWQTIRIAIKNSTGSSLTPSFSSDFAFGTDVTAARAIANGAIDIYVANYSALKGKYLIIGVSGGF